MSLKDEIEKIPELKNIGLALVDYAVSLFHGIEFEQSGTRWVARPKNYVTFEVHWKRAKNIAISLRGNPSEFLAFDELPLKQGMAGYSECKITNQSQLAAASTYIRRAAEIYQRGRDRERTTPRVVE